MDKIKTLNFYIGGDAGCVDVAEAKLTGYTLVSDKDLKRLEDENEKLKLLSCAKSIADGLGALIEAASSAAELLGFLSHHLRGRLPDNALLDMASKADKLIVELEKIK